MFITCVQKTPWTKEEDQLLVNLFNLYPNKWADIARHVPGRTDDACAKRYREALDPNLRQGEWTPAEDEQLLAARRALGEKWSHIGSELNRSSLACRNRWLIIVFFSSLVA